MSKVYLSLGSNMGERKVYLEQAVRALSQLDNTELIAVSPIYETAAWGNTNQDDFLNIDTPEKAYLLGFIQSDGSLREDIRLFD